MPQLFLVRHAEPTTKGVLLGRTDPPLSVQGRRQAEALAASLPATAAVYASPLRRAAETAEILAPGRVHLLRDLVEIALGEWDGLPWTAIEQRDPAFAARKIADWLGVTPPGGEPWPDFARRIRRALDSILTGPLPALVVAHVTVNSELAHQLDGTDPVGFLQDYCAIRTYDVPPAR